MTEQELKLSTKLIKNYASQPDADEKIELLLESLFACYPQEQKDSLNVQENNNSSVSTIIIFKPKELSKMEKTFKKEFIANGLAAHVRRRIRCNNSINYEIRYRRNGYDITVYGTTLEIAKENFIMATSPNNIEKYRRKDVKEKANSFMRVAQEWLEYKKGKLNDRTHKNYESYCQRYLYVPLGSMPISEIKTIDITKIMNTVEGRLYEDLRVVLNSVFKYALANGLLTHNPMLLIPFKKAERNNRRALTKDEKKKLFERLEMPEFSEYKLPFMIMYFFGLRPCELEDSHFEGDFLIARNAKRKGGKIEYKKIPIHKNFRAMFDLTEITMPHRTDVLNRIFKRIMNDEEVTQYFLRHTFATICQQSVRPDIVDIWMGDSSERLVGRVYTHFEDDFMYEQMQTVKFDI